MATPTFEAKYRQIAFFVIVGLSLLAGAAMVKPFIGAILWAGVFSVLMWPTYRRLRVRFSENASAGLTVGATLGLIVLPLLLIGLMIGLQIGGFVSQIAAAQPVVSGKEAPSLTLDTVAHELDQRVEPVLRSLGVQVDVKEWVTDHRDQIVRTMTGPLTEGAYATGYTVFTLVVALLTMFFMLRDGHRMLDPVMDLIPLPRDTATGILTKMRDTIWAVFVGVVLVALIQGSLAGLLYLVTGIPGWLLLGVATIVLCIIPLLGAPVIYLPVALLMAAQGKWWQAIVIACFGWFVISTIDNLLRPFFIGARTNLHPMAIFFSLLGGVFAMGPVGVMAGPVLLTVLLAIQDVIRERRKLALEPLPSE